MLGQEIMQGSNILQCNLMVHQLEAVSFDGIGNRGWMSIKYGGDFIYTSTITFIIDQSDVGMSR